MEMMFANGQKYMFYLMAPLLQLIFAVTIYTLYTDNGNTVSTVQIG